MNKLLEERKKTHGDFKVNAAISQDLKTVLHRKIVLDYVLKEALDNIAQKLARIIAGNPHELDHWRDVIGYSQLALNYLQDKKEKEYGYTQL